MSVVQDDTTLYCSTKEVARYFRGNPVLTDNRDFPTEANADPGEPTQGDVQAFIEKWSSRFDRRTGQSFRNNQILNETHDHDRLYYWLSGHPINVMKRNIITPLDASKGDKLEIWTGNKWEDWIAEDTRTEGRDGDYWVDSAVGTIFVYERAILRPHPKFRVSYRYGRDGGSDGVADCPADVRDAIAAAAASDLINTDVYGTTVPGNNQSGNSDPQQAAGTYYKQYKRVAADYKKVEFI